MLVVFDHRRIIRAFPVLLELLHVAPGIHSFDTIDATVARPDVDGPDRTIIAVSQSDDPDRVAAIIRAESVAGERKGDVRCVSGMGRNRIGAGRIEIELGWINPGAFARTDDRAVRGALRNNPIILDHNLADAVGRGP